MTGEDTKESGQTIEKKPAGKGGGSRRLLLYAAVVILLILAAAYLTIGVIISEAPAAASYPYTTTYQVSLPNSQVVTIGNTQIIAVPSEDRQRVTLSVNGDPKEMGIGETRTVQERRAVITALAVRIMDFDFRLDSTYKGSTGDTSQFYLAFKTSRQVPSFLIGRLLPANVQARPV